MKHASLLKPSKIGPALQAREKWLQLFREWDIRRIILDPQADAALVKAVRSQPGWMIDYEDSELVTFTRAEPGENFSPVTE